MAKVLISLSANAKEFPLNSRQPKTSKDSNLARRKSIVIFLWVIITNQKINKTIKLRFHLVRLSIRVRIVENGPTRTKRLLKRLLTTVRFGISPVSCNTTLWGRTLFSNVNLRFRMQKLIKNKLSARRCRQKRKETLLINKEQIKIL